METTTENQIAVIIDGSGLEKTKGQLLLEKFSGFFESAAEWEQKVNALTLEQPKEAREMRLALAKVRTGSENVRKEMKEQSLREGQTIDSIAKIIKNLITPLEEKAEKIEKHAEIQAAAEREQRKTERLNKLTVFNIAIEPNMIADMSEDMFNSYLSGVKKDHEEKLERERKAEEERIAKEKAEAEEREKQRQENIRLKAEAEAREKEMEAERQKAVAEKKKIEEKAAKEKAAAEAKLKAEKEAREKLEREIKLKADLEAKEKMVQEVKEAAEKAEKEKAERAAAIAPKKEKLTKWVEGFVIGVPVGMPEDQTVTDIHVKFEAFKNWAKGEINKIK
jgi:DNA polymerase III alpha subunit (gram-positive type)